MLVASLFGDAGGAGGVGVCNIRGWNLFCHACEAFEEDREGFQEGSGISSRDTLLKSLEFHDS